jgi:hypothetical protein
MTISQSYWYYLNLVEEHSEIEKISNKNRDKNAVVYENDADEFMKQIKESQKR